MLSGEGFKVTVTTLTNKTVIIENCSPYDTVDDIKQKYQDQEGVPPNQQTLWFPVPKDKFDAARPATDFKWWDAVKDRLESDLAASMTSAPLLKGEDIPEDGGGSNMPAASLGVVLAAREGSSPQYLPLPDLTLPCFMVLQLRPSPGETDGDPSGMQPAQSDADVIFEAIWEDSKTPALRKCFELFDADQSGFLDKDELKAILTRTGPGASLNHESADQIIAEFDVDGDGKISIDEFVKVMQSA